MELLRIEFECIDNEDECDILPFKVIASSKVKSRQVYSHEVSW